VDSSIFKLISLTLFVFSFSSLKAQDAVLCTGTNTSGNGGSVSYSVGQTAFITNTGINGSVAQGVQQAYEIFILTGSNNNINISLNFIAYPNPTTNYLILKADSYTDEKLLYQLFDINGRLLLSNKIKNTETTIPMMEFIAATYYLKITEGHKNVKTFKIIKH